MKFPAFLDELLDTMRAKGVASVEFDRPDVGKLRVELYSENENAPFVVAPPRVDVTPADATPFSATPTAVHKMSDINLALNPPKLDITAPDEEANPAEAIASLKAPRETAPAGASEPDTDE